MAFVSRTHDSVQHPLSLSRAADTHAVNATTTAWPIAAAKPRFVHFTTGHPRPREIRPT